MNNQAIAEEEVGEALAAIPDPFMNTVLQSVEKHAGYEAARELAQVRDAAVADSREDEVCDRCGHEIEDPVLHYCHPDTRSADEPEGDEPYICENCGERIGHHTPGSDVEACSTFQPPPPTDEPVSGEGEENGTICGADSGAGAICRRQPEHDGPHRGDATEWPATHADARSGGEFGDPPRPGESKKQFAERVLDEAQEAPSWDAYVYSLACGLYDAEKQTYPEPSMESDGTALTDRHEEESDE